MNKKWLSACSMLVGCVALGAAGYWWVSSHRLALKPASPVETIVLGTVFNEIAALVWVAESKGYFLDSGLEVVVKEYQSGNFALDDLLKGGLDVAMCSEFPFIEKVLGGNHSHVCLGHVSKVTNTKVVYRHGSGISRPEDLKRKNIGVTFSTIGPFLLDEFLLFNGLKLDDVIAVDIKPFDMKDALSSGIVDAVIVWEPNVWNIETALGGAVSSWPGQGNQSYYWLIVSTREKLNTKANALDRLFEALARADTFLMKNGSEAKALVANRLNFSPAYMERMWPMTEYDLSLDQTLLMTMEKEARWIIKNNSEFRAMNTPDSLLHINARSLYRVKPNLKRVAGVDAESE